jgi:hypothetical protein
MWIVVFWVVMPCVVGCYKYFKIMYYLSLCSICHFLSYLEDGGDIFLQNPGNHIQDCMVSQPRKP